MRKVVESLEAVLRNNHRAVLATVVAVEGASPARPGFKPLVDDQGARVGNVGGGRLQAEAQEEGGG